MSLLMKALEKAAKDRGETQQQPGSDAVAPPPAATTRAAELTLEPLQADAPSPPPLPDPAPSRTAAKPHIDRNQARAATVMQAAAGAAPAPAPAAAGSRMRPIIVIGLVAGVVILGFAVYVYLQITNPGMFIRQPPVPAAKPPASPLPQATAPLRAPIATGTVINPAAGAAAEPVMQSREAAPQQSARGQVAPAAASAGASEQPRNNIQVSAGAAEPQLNPQLSQAYAALQSGKLDAARQLYSDAASGDPRNINALLGLAAIAMQDGRTDEASRLYVNVLDLEPRNPYAQAGLIAMMGRADPVAAESKLKQLISREPLASLYFTLGNLYGDQSRWAEAQQAYFQAYQMESGNPDYAYNLAVGLEHVGQHKLAASFYQRAVELAKTRGRVGFNAAQAQDRIRQLSALPQ